MPKVLHTTISTLKPSYVFTCLPAICFKYYVYYDKVMAANLTCATGNNDTLLAMSSWDFAGHCDPSSNERLKEHYHLNHQPVGDS